MKKLKPISRILIAVSALLMVSAYFVPLWQILMWAPQYPEGLDMKIWINNITGDVKIISALNHYIGMKHIEVSMFPEFGYMIYIVGAIIVVGLIAALTNRRLMVIVYSIVIVAAGVAALIDFYIWGYQYGHNLDPSAPIVVPGMSYQPPLLGTKQLLNFTAYSGPDIGGWIFLVSGVLAIGTCAYEIVQGRKAARTSAHVVGIVAAAAILWSCSTSPEPLVYGKDGCQSCKMTLTDHKFGGEIVTRKGKIYKFDDVNCMLNFMRTERITEEQAASLMITDYSEPGRLIDARSAFYVRSEAVRSPMAGNIAAFETEQSREKMNEQLQGTYLKWSDLIN